MSFIGAVGHHRVPCSSFNPALSRKHFISSNEIFRMLSLFKKNSSQLTALLILMSLMIFACFHLEKHDLFWIHGQIFVLNAEPKNTMQWSYQNEHDDPMALGRKKPVKPVETADNLFPSAYELWKPFASHRCVCFSRWKIQWFLSCCWFCKATKKAFDL